MKLVNPNSNAVTQKLYDYICENYGRKMMTGAQESCGNETDDMEFKWIQEVTGKEPAIRGLDFISEDYQGTIERSESWWNRGGIVSICWHMGIYGGGYPQSQNDIADFDLLLTEGTPENQKMIAKWDEGAKALLTLQEKGIPVLWRPFHEFDGAWFWWGKGTPENFADLWRLMYHRYTDHFKLNNLIWVLGYSDKMTPGNWYPGDEYCDIIGSDTYSHTTNDVPWNLLQPINQAGKPLALHECGFVQPISKYEEDGDLWSWFLTWHTQFLTVNDPEVMRAVYHDDKAITLDKLPRFN